jgi:hypothetical protein
MMRASFASLTRRATPPAAHMQLNLQCRVLPGKLDWLAQQRLHCCPLALRALALVLTSCLPHFRATGELHGLQHLACKRPCSACAAACLTASAAGCHASLHRALCGRRRWADAAGPIRIGRRHAAALTPLPRRRSRFALTFYTACEPRAQAELCPPARDRRWHLAARDGRRTPWGGCRHRCPPCAHRSGFARVISRNTSPAWVATRS